MPLQGIANSGFAAATCFGMLVGETHAGAVVVELGRACGKQGRSGQRQRRFWQSLGNHQQWIYNMLRDESSVGCSRSVEGLLALHVALRPRTLQSSRSTSRGPSNRGRDVLRDTPLSALAARVIQGYRAILQGP